MKKWILVSMVLMFFSFPFSASAKMGELIPKSKDIEVKFFGSVKTYPTFLGDVDLNSKDTEYDRILDENGWMADHNVRNELRMGWVGKGDNWDFLIILEADFNLSKAHADRGADLTQSLDSGMTGEDFGVEKLNLRYNFGPVAIKTGWNTRFLDIMTGGVLYGDDHPYIGLEGKLGNNF